jgi:hypothetical protein
VNDTMTIDEIVREEFAEDDLFIGPVGDQPRLSFRVAHDVYEGYSYWFDLVMNKFTRSLCGLLWLYWILCCQVPMSVFNKLGFSISCQRQKREQCWRLIQVGIQSET